MNKWKRVLTAGVLACALTVGAASAATVTVRGTSLPASAGTFLLNDRTYVPLRAVVNLMDPSARITWQDGTATVTTDKLTLTATVGQRWMQANGRYFYLPDGVKLVDNTMMVHVRTLAEAMGGSVTWDASSRSVDVTAGDGIPSAPAYSEEDLYWLARIISAESQGESLEGKLAVGSVVLNRMNDPQFPGTLHDVIYQRNQFSVVNDGAIRKTPSAEAIIAAKLCMEGVTVTDALFFNVRGLRCWAATHRSYIATIGNHDFYA